MKTLGIILGCIVGLIVLLVAVLIIKNQIDMKKSWLEEDYFLSFDSGADLEGKYAGMGIYKVSSMEIKLDDKKIQNIRIWYPSELAENEKQYPMVIITNASNMAALNYKPFFERLATWGFIVVGNDDRQAGTGESTSKTLDYMLRLAKNQESIFYRKISENIGCVGYSQGGAGAINAVTAFDNSDKFKALFTGSAAYPLLATNMGWQYDVTKIEIPYFMTAGIGTSDDTGVSDINAEFGGVAPLASLIGNYTLVDNSEFKVRARISGAEHEDMQTLSDGYMTAWMLYNLQNDEEAKKVFVGEDAEILTNSHWQDIEKNQ